MIEANAILRQSVVSKRSEWAILVLAVTAGLLSGATFNGFPLVHPDSGTYLRVGLGIGWSVDRSGYYGLLMRPFLLVDSGPTALWLWLMVQALAIGVILLCAARRIAPRAGPFALLLVTGATILFSALPWHAGQLMPDAFTGPMILAAWLAATRSPLAPGQLLLWAAIVVLGLTHITHLLILPGVCGAALLCEYFRGVPYRFLSKQLMAVILACTTIAAAQIGVNFLQLGVAAVSPAEPIFLFASLNEDGHIKPWLDAHCGIDASPQLCAIRRKLPHDSRELLWGPNSSVYWPVSREMPRWMARFDQANKGAIISHPAAVLGTSLAGGVSQLLEYGALDDECPELCADPTRVLRLSFKQAGPSYAAALEHSRQMRGSMPNHAVRTLTAPLTTLAMIALVPLLVFACRRRDAEAAGLIATVLAALLLNAFLTGALSAVDARYQSRVAWLAPFILLGLLLRWRMEGGRVREPLSSAHVEAFNTPRSRSG